MPKNKVTTEYYSLKNILSHNVGTYIVIGERSNGKTYSVKKRIIEAAKNGAKFMYIRREHRYIARAKMVKLFSDINDYAYEQLGGFINYSTELGFYIETEHGDTTIGYCTSLEDAYAIKSIPYNDVTIVLFDEFIDYSYMQDETARYLHVISTIVRERTNVEVFLLANTVSKFCPYFDLFGIDINKIQKGQIAVLKHKLGGTVAIERCSTKVSTKGEITEGKKSKYLGFDNNHSVDMILFGEWEYNECNTKQVDGISWASQRRRVNCYVTALAQVYEMSISKTQFPVAFVRKINTQDGIVKQDIRYNLSYDNSLVLVTYKGYNVPAFSVVVNLMDESIRKDLDVVKQCLVSKRIVFDNVETGTEFTKVFTKMI